MDRQEGFGVDIETVKSKLGEKELEIMLLIATVKKLNERIQKLQDEIKSKE